MYDSHLHTVSSDGRNTVDEMCRAAIAANVDGIMITDHADMNFYASRDTYCRIKNGIEQIRVAQQTYAQQLQLLCGVELGEYLYAPDSAKRILELTEYDAVLCSVHFLPNEQWNQPYNRIPFSRIGTDKELLEYLKLYLELLSRTVDSFEFDILAHLSCPVRYMTGLHGRNADIMQFEPLIREILKKVIDRNIALEWNTGGMHSKFRFCCIQNEEVFSLYRSMGGELVTLGSDAHSIGSIANDFVNAKALLKQCGFTQYHYFKNRIPYSIVL